MEERGAAVVGEKPREDKQHLTQSGWSFLLRQIDIELENGKMGNKREGNFPTFHVFPSLPPARSLLYECSIFSQQLPGNGMKIEVT